MLNRTVLMKLNDRVDSGVIARMQAYAARIGRELDEVQSYHLAPNLGAGEGDFNWVIQASFASEADMTAYGDAPLHREFVDYCAPYAEDFLVTYHQAPGGIEDTGSS
ncbi:MAG: Dabb family protein [Alphaproteobacteria bacterium]|nr:Dabb family protein [Alphaproteobacteria bacterium]